MVLVIVQPALLVLLVYPSLGCEVDRMLVCAADAAAATDMPAALLLCSLLGGTFIGTVPHKFNHIVYPKDPFNNVTCCDTLITE